MDRLGAFLLAFLMFQAAPGGLRLPAGAVPSVSPPIRLRFDTPLPDTARVQALVKDICEDLRGCLAQAAALEKSNQNAGEQGSSAATSLWAISRMQCQLAVSLAQIGDADGAKSHFRDAEQTAAGIGPGQTNLGFAASDVPVILVDTKAVALEQIALDELSANERAVARLTALGVNDGGLRFAALRQLFDADFAAKDAASANALVSEIERAADSDSRFDERVNKLCSLAIDLFKHNEKAEADRLVAEALRAAEKLPERNRGMLDPLLQVIAGTQEQIGDRAEAEKTAARVLPEEAGDAMRIPWFAIEQERAHDPMGAEKTFEAVLTATKPPLTDPMSLLLLWADRQAQLGDPAGARLTLRQVVHRYNAQRASAPGGEPATGLLRDDMASAPGDARFVNVLIYLRDFRSAVEVAQKITSANEKDYWLSEIAEDQIIAKDVVAGTRTLRLVQDPLRCSFARELIAIEKAKAGEIDAAKSIADQIVNAQGFGEALGGIAGAQHRAGDDSGARSTMAVARQRVLAMHIDPSWKSLILNRIGIDQGAIQDFPGARMTLLASEKIALGYAGSGFVGSRRNGASLATIVEDQAWVKDTEGVRQSIALLPDAEEQIRVLGTLAARLVTDGRWSEAAWAVQAARNCAAHMAHLGRRSEALNLMIEQIAQGDHLRSGRVHQDNSAAKEIAHSDESILWGFRSP